MEGNTQLSVIDVAKDKFVLACKDAASLQTVNNFVAAFTAVNVVTLLREALTDEVMNKVFMPLMNTKVGFLTDRPTKDKATGRIMKPAYGVDVVRDAIIDAVTIGIMPTGNQMNIIAERMYPTKEGYTALLKRIGVKYFLDVSYDKGQNPNFAEIPVKINYEHNGEKNSFTVVATVKKDSYSSHDQLRGKAERKAKKALYEYITGCDYGDADETSGVIDADYEEIPVDKKVQQEIKQNANAETLSMGASETAQNQTPPPANSETAQSQTPPPANNAQSSGTGRQPAFA